jgi:hypothetical protein
MDYTDRFHASEQNEYDNDSHYGSKPNEKELDNLKKMDRGYTKIYRSLPRNGRMKRTKIELYTSGQINSHIRDAETGIFYKYKVGSADEDLFFKVILATGECLSKNGSNTLFFSSPKQYMDHLYSDCNEEIMEDWNMKRDKRIEQLKEKVIKKVNVIEVK